MLENMTTVFFKALNLIQTKNVTRTITFVILKRIEDQLTKTVF